MSDHGTLGGYHQHRRADEVPCWPCTDAAADYMRWNRRWRKRLVLGDLLADKPQLRDLPAAGAVLRDLAAGAA